MAPVEPRKSPGCLYSGDSVSAVARRNCVAPNMLLRWRKLILEGFGAAPEGMKAPAEPSSEQTGGAHASPWLEMMT